MEERQETPSPDEICVRNYQQEMLEASLTENIIVAQDTGSGKTHIAILRIRIECDRELRKVSWFLAPTVALCEQQRDVISKTVAGSVGLIHGGLEPKQWTDPNIWKTVLEKNRVVVSTPQVLLDALSHGYVNLGRDIGLLVFDEAHHANDNHPMNRIMIFYFSLPVRRTTLPPNHGTVREERPIILGLTASPMFGGSAVQAFSTLEKNLDSTIRSPQKHRDELLNYVHRPTFRHVLYFRAEPYEKSHLASPNIQALTRVIESMNIEQDPYVLTLRGELRKASASLERHRIDQKLSKVISKQNSFTHKGLRDLLTTACDLCWDLGPWAADWYIEKVVTLALGSASPYSGILESLQLKEKAYLIKHLNKIELTPVSYEPSFFDHRLSDKVWVLINTLMEEKGRSESFDEPYSGLLFVTRRDAVLALSEILEHHPRTRGVFRVGCLVGSSESAYRTALLDITRKMIKDSHGSTLSDFRSGDKNLVVATSVAEEGLDIQACGNVIRWDVPNNMVSWAQSRGRARKRHSSFVLMFDSGGADNVRISKFEALEAEMTALYDDQRKNSHMEICDPTEDPAYRETATFKVESTGAVLTLQGAVSHLNHFCALLSKSQHHCHQPLYDIDPPDMPEGWHSLNPHQRVTPYAGPFGCTLTLPKMIGAKLRIHTVERIYPSKRSAYQRVAFKAYVALYRAGLLNHHLLPLTSIPEAQLDEEVEKLLKDIEKKAGMSAVARQLNPWQPRDSEKIWWCAKIIVDGLPLLELLTQVPISVLPEDEALFLYHPLHGKLKVTITPSRSIRIAAQALQTARHYTRRLFWSRHGARMTWQHLDFAYLFSCPRDPESPIWEERREWAKKQNGDVDSEKGLLANADEFGKVYNYPTDINCIRDFGSINTPCRFVRWHFERLATDDEEALQDSPKYSRIVDFQLTYPLLVVEPLPSKANFLLLTSSNVTSAKKSKQLFLVPKYAYVDLLSSAEREFSILVPSILRHLTVVMTAQSLRQSLFEDEPKLATIPIPLLTEAITAPAASDPVNYQRLESLGDAVLKFIVAANLMAQHSLWHEGYLTRRKDHVVNNARLAKAAIKISLFRWIIRNRFTPRKYTPLYLIHPAEPMLEENLSSEAPVTEDGEPRSEIEHLSTKMLADVVESLIGAAYLHGGFDLSTQCIQRFQLGLKLYQLEECVGNIVDRVELTDGLSNQLALAEQMIGYTFQRKLLLIEALSHASSQYDTRTVSYERLEFLGDALLDMIVIDYLYLAPGHHYDPGDMHILKASIVNTHFLAYCCLQLSLEVDASMPGPGEGHRITMQHKTDRSHFYQWLQHSSPTILEEQRITYARFEKNNAEIAEALCTGKYYPWAALTRLQAPKFFSDMIESLIGAVYLDSYGNIEVVCKLLRVLGILDTLERIIRDNVDVLHPVSRVGIWASKQKKEVDYEFKEERGCVVCTLVVEGLEAIQAEAERRGNASREEARFAVAEKAMALWEIGDVWNKPRNKI